MDGSDRAALPIAWNHNASMSHITAAAAGASESRYGCCTAFVVDNAAAAAGFRICLLLVIESVRFRDSTAASSGGQPRLHGRGSFCHGSLASSPKTTPVVGFTWWIWRHARQVTGS